MDFVIGARLKGAPGDLRLLLLWEGGGRADHGWTMWKPPRWQHMSFLGTLGPSFLWWVQRKLGVHLTSTRLSAALVRTPWCPSCADRWTGLQVGHLQRGAPEPWRAVLGSQTGCCSMLDPASQQGPGRSSLPVVSRLDGLWGEEVTHFPGK